MTRPLALGNGSLLVALDNDLSIRDLTYPHVGLLNHLNGNSIRLGVWTEGRFAWLSDPAWRKRLLYEDDTLVTRAECEHPDLELTLVVSDCVSHRDNILLRAFTFHNRADRAREVRLFLSHDFNIAETDIGDTAFYNPFLDAVIHYKRDNYFLISGSVETGSGTEAKTEGVFQYTTGIKGFNGAEGTWRDAEDGALTMNPVEQGSVDSTVSFRVEVGAHSEAKIQSWLCVGATLDEVTWAQRHVKEVGFETLRANTANYWRAWSHSHTQSERLDRLPAPIQALFRRSLLTIRTQADNHGAIMAANDSDIMATARANYSYMWPRDGALVAFALDRLGYQDITRRFFLFCRNGLPKDRPALMHKYSADGSWGATWHPWQVDGQSEVPFQQDSTALVLWALWRHYTRHRDLEFVERLYQTFVTPAGDFMADFRDPQTGLPRPSYDLWEERRGIHAYTCGAVYGALEASAQFARLFHDKAREEIYTRAATEVRDGIRAHFWDEGAGRYVRRLTVGPDGTWERDLTIDSALMALFAFGAFPATDERVAATLNQTFERLRVQTEIGGVARYENDYYFRRSDDTARVPGNPWIICTLWQAQFIIARAQTLSELTPALDILQWVADRALPSGVLPEQLDPYTGQPLSVAPLTWSHAEFVATTQRYLDRLEELG